MVGVVKEVNIPKSIHKNPTFEYKCCRFSLQVFTSFLQLQRSLATWVLIPIGYNVDLLSSRRSLFPNSCCIFDRFWSRLS